MSYKNNQSKYLFTLLLSMIMPHAIANTFADIDVAAIHDDNLSRSNYAPDIKSGSAIETFADYGKFFDLKNNWSATATVFAQYTKHINFNRLSSSGLGVSGSVRKKLGLGAYSSSIQISASNTTINVVDTKRSNNALDFSVSWDKRLNDIWEVSAGISLDNSIAKNKIFNSDGSTVYFSTDYTLSEKVLFSFGLSQRRGDIITVTNASANPNEVNWQDLSRASDGNNISDDVFGAGLTAYRINATTLIFKMAVSYALNDESALNAGYEYQNSTLAYDVKYNNNILRVNYIYNF